MDSAAVTITPDAPASGVTITPDVAPTGTISAIKPPTGIMDSIARWSDKVASDIKYGTDETGIGTVLKKMGAHGVYSGNSQAVGDFMASMPLGLLRAGKGQAEVAGGAMDADTAKMRQGGKDTLMGTLQASTIPSSFVAPEAGEAATEGASKVAGAIADAIPSTSRARQGFQEVMAAAKDQPVTLQSSQDGILKLMDWQKKTQLGPTVNKFLNRVTNPKLGPLTYEEGRDFYQLLGRMSADEASKLPPAIRFDLTKMVIGLKADIGDAAAAVGKGGQYLESMAEYARAARMKDALAVMGKFAAKAAIGAAGVAGAKAAWDMIP